ncbi:MAG TPA: hypothetical protein VIU61_13665 [Kofleriaceae bacterium]
MRTLMILMFSLTAVVACDKKEPAKTDPAKTDPAKVEGKTSDLLNPPAGGAAAGGVAPVDKATPEEIEKGKDVNPAAVATGNPTDDELIGLMEKMAIVVEKNPKDCVKLAAELKAFTDANSATVKKFEAWGKKASDEEKKAFAMRAASRMMPIIAKLAPAAACAMDPNFKKAVEGLPLGGG